MLRPGPVLSSNSPQFISLLRLLYPPLASFVAGQALSVVRTRIHNPNPGNLPFPSPTLAYTRGDTDSLQAREIPVILCPPKRPAPPRNSSRRDVYSTLQFYPA